MTMSMTDTPFLNNVNAAGLIAAKEALTAEPSLADFTWRATCEWVDGTHSRSTVSRFSGLGQEHTHKTVFEIGADHPECFFSEDRGATPVEIVLCGLASCLTAGIAAVAAQRQIAVRSVTATVEGDMNVLGILGADPDIRNGFSGVTVTFDVDADASPEAIRALVAQSQKRSAVYDIITNPGSVEVRVA
jgi:uncharacterized OsmC-like protein